MTIELSCSDLGIMDCDWVATGKTPGEVVEQVVEHLRRDQNMSMPDPEAIIEGDFESPLSDAMDPAVATVIRRLREELNLRGMDNTADTDKGISGARVKSP